MTAPAPIRTQLENAVMDALSPLLKSKPGGYLRTVAPYAGELSPSREDPHFQRITQGYLPAVLVTTDDGAYNDHAIGRLADLNLEVVLLFASSNLRAPEANQRGDMGASADPGIYRMLEDVRGRLFRRELGVSGVGFLIPVSESSVLRAADRSIWQQVYAVQTDANHASIESELESYERIQNDLNFPIADPGAPLNPVVEFDNTLLVP
jgi:hypothetical protein